MLDALFRPDTYCGIRVCMGKSTTMVSQKKRGPAATGKGTPVMVRLQPDMLAGVDQFVAEHEDISRPEAVRLIIRDWMTKNQVIRGE